MPTVARVRWEKLDYGWLFKLSGLLDVMDFIGKRFDPTGYKRDFPISCVLERYLGFVGVSGANTEHLSHSDGFAIYCRCLTSASGLEAVSAFAKDLLSGMLKSIDETGAIYVNSKGGYFSSHPNFEEYETREVSEWVLPQDKISVKKWPGGKHWYASVGGRNVEIGGMNKWTSKAFAELEAERWAKKNGIVLEQESE